MKVETVKIVSPVTADNPHGFIVINKADLRDEHVLFGVPAKPAKKPVLTLPVKGQN